MPDITNAEAIRFVNEQVRPLAEKLRAIRAQGKDALTEWFAGLNTTIGSKSDDAIADKREAEGVSRLTAADVTSFMAAIDSLCGLSSDAAIEKPTVRPLRAE